MVNMVQPCYLSFLFVYYANLYWRVELMTHFPQPWNDVGSRLVITARHCSTTRGHRTVLVSLAFFRPWLHCRLYEIESRNSIFIEYFLNFSCGGKPRINLKEHKIQQYIKYGYWCEGERISNQLIFLQPFIKAKMKLNCIYFVQVLKIDAVYSQHST